jgi:hypothetical protein
VVTGSTTTGNFNYSSYYGIPDNLPVVDFGKLTNFDELNLQSLVNSGKVSEKMFSLLDPPQTRYFDFEVTQVLGSPDGYQKPMIAINGEPLRKVNRQDNSQGR